MNSLPLHALSWLEQWHDAQHVNTETSRLLDAKARNVTYHFSGDGWQRVEAAHYASIMLGHCFPYDSPELKCTSPTLLHYHLQDANQEGCIIASHQPPARQSLATELSKHDIALFISHGNAPPNRTEIEETLTHPLWCVMHGDNVHLCSDQLATNI